MSTPALDRAARDLCTADSSYWHHEQTDDYPCSSCVEKAQTAVSAALHHPDDPLWLERVLVVAWYEGRDQADAVRAAILGEAV